LFTPLKQVKEHMISIALSTYFPATMHLFRNTNKRCLLFPFGGPFPFLEGVILLSP